MSHVSNHDAQIRAGDGDVFQQNRIRKLQGAWTNKRRALMNVDGNAQRFGFSKQGQMPGILRVPVLIDR
jgi:hypothetical protein